MGWWQLRVNIAVNFASPPFQGKMPGPWELFQSGNEILNQRACTNEMDLPWNYCTFSHTNERHACVHAKQDGVSHETERRKSFPLYAHGLLTGSC